MGVVGHQQKKDMQHKLFTLNNLYVGRYVSKLPILQIPLKFQISQTLWQHYFAMNLKAEQQRLNYRIPLSAAWESKLEFVWSRGAEACEVKVSEGRISFFFVFVTFIIFYLWLYQEDFMHMVVVIMIKVLFLPMWKSPKQC